MKAPKDKTGTQRQQRLRERGRQVSALLLDPEAIARWDALLAQHGTQRAALEALLKTARELDHAGLRHD